MRVALHVISFLGLTLSSALAFQLPDGIQLMQTGIQTGIQKATVRLNQTGSLSEDALLIQPALLASASLAQSEEGVGSSNQLLVQPLKSREAKEDVSPFQVPGARTVMLEIEQAPRKSFDLLQFSSFEAVCTRLSNASVIAANSVTDSWKAAASQLQTSFHALSWQMKAVVASATLILLAALAHAVCHRLARKDHASDQALRGSPGNEWWA
jgi:hypothetical protein